MYFRNIWENAILRMPLIFLESIGNDPFGHKNNYLKGEIEKNWNLLEIYEEVLRYCEANKSTHFGKGSFLYDHVEFLLRKK